MNDQTRDALRLRLENERASLQNEIAELRDTGIKATTFLEDEGDAYDNHMADDASALFERQKNMSLLQNLEREAEDVKHALELMDRGTYGICEQCGRPIAEKRLLARPMATTCIDCQSAREQHERGAASLMEPSV